MYSYNNIIEKGEPKNKECIDHALDDIFVRNSSELHAVQRQVHPSVDCIMVESFLTPAECDALLATCDEVGYSFWRQHTHEATDGEATCDASAKAVRMVDTIEANFPALSKLLYERISSVVELLPKSFSAEMENADALYDRELDGSWAPYALAENLLLGRYYPGGHFMPHIDGSTVVDINTRSFYTLLIYLNDCPAGGETFLFNGEQHEVMFLDPVSGKYRGRSERRCGEVRPQKGAAAFFYYDLLHEGAPVVEGLKYICRADLLYRRNPPILTSESDQKAFELYQAARIAEGNGEAMRACDMFRQVRRISPGVAHFYQLD